MTLPWLTWVALAVNFGASFVNTYAALRMRSRIRRWDKVRAEWDASRQKVEQFSADFGKLLGFVASLAHAPDGALPEGVRSTARSLIPPEVTLLMHAEEIASDRVH